MRSTNFDLTFHPTDSIRSTERRSYRIEAKTEEGEASDSFTIPLARLRVLEERLHADTINGSGSQAEIRRAVLDLGHEIFEMTFRGRVRDLFFLSYGRSRARSELLRIRFRFSDSVPELAVLPWEYLCWKSPLQRYLALGGDASIVRLLGLPEQHLPLRCTLPLRVLVVTASPRDAGKLNPDKHRQAVAQALAPLSQEGLAKIMLVDQAQPASLIRALESGDFDVLHIAAHGQFDESLREGSLLLEDFLRRGNPLPGQDLATILRLYPPKLVTLCACESGNGSPHSFADGLAQQLILQGIPAVIAMLLPVREEDALKLTEILYTALAREESLDHALIRARVHLKSSHPSSWGIPALFLRSPDSYLFQLPPHFGHPFRRQLLVLEEALRENPGQGVRAVCEIKLPTTGNSREVLTELRQIQDCFIDHQNQTKTMKPQRLEDRLQRFLELLATLESKS